MKQRWFSLILVISFALCSYAPKAEAVIVSFPEMICEAIKHNKTRQFKRITQVYRIKLIHFYPDSLCEGQSLLRYALTHDAQAVGVYMVKQLPVKMLAIKEKDGLDLLSWSEQKRLKNTPIMQLVESRVSTQR